MRPTAAKIVAAGSAVAKAVQTVEAAKTVAKTGRRRRWLPIANGAEGLLSACTRSTPQSRRGRSLHTHWRPGEAPAAQTAASPRWWSARPAAPSSAQSRQLCGTQATARSWAPPVSRLRLHPITTYHSILQLVACRRDGSMRACRPPACLSVRLLSVHSSCMDTTPALAALLSPRNCFQRLPS
jgi:hypothetical protein